MSTNPQPEATQVEFLRDGHVVSKCGVPLLEYLLYYATQRGLQVGAPTKAGKKQHGKHVSLIMKGGALCRASFLDDVKGQKLRRLSARKFLELCDNQAGRPKRQKGGRTK
jgi:hypothetical protein